MKNIEIADKIVKIAESLIESEEARLTASDYEEFFAASDELEELETTLAGDFNNNVKIDDGDAEEVVNNTEMDKDAGEDISEDEEEDTEEVTMKDVAASLIGIAKELAK